MARLDYPSLPFTLPWLAKFFLQCRPQKRFENGRRLWPLIASSAKEHHHLLEGTEAGRYWKTTGRATIYRREHGFLDQAAYLRVAEENGVPFEILSPQDLCALEPFLKPNFVKAVLWPSTQRLTNPSAYIKSLAEAFTAKGGTFLRNNVSRINAFDGKWRVGTTEGTIETRNIVLCLGPWTTDITKRLGYDFPLGFKRGYHLHYMAEGSAHLSHTISDAEYGFALAPMEQGYRLTTGAEFAKRDAPPHPHQLDLILPLARELFPLGSSLEQTPWMGSRPCLPDSQPVIGAAPRHKGLWFNFGHGHVGLTIGPSSGRLLAEIMTGETAFCDPSPYRAGRFNC